MLSNIVHAGAKEHNSAGRSYLPVLVSVVILLGAALFFFFKPDKNQREQPRATTELSEATLQTLQQLDAPVEVRFYSILDPKIDPDLPDFSQRVSTLLQTYAEASNGKIQVKTVDTEAADGPTSAVADGLRPFNLEKGDASFLGLAIESQGYKEVLARLSPEFESALEADITRALQRLISSIQNSPGTSRPQATDPAILESVKTIVQDYAGTSLEEGAKALQGAMLLELEQVSKENQARLAQAQAALEKAGATEQEAARKALQQVEAENTARMQEVLATATARLRALQELKSSK